MQSATGRTTNRDIFGWALVALAAEPYVVSALGTYMPILLEQLARSNGVSPIDKITPCINHPDQPIPTPPPPEAMKSETCVLPILNGKFYVDTSSYALYTFSLAVFFQTICVLTVSGIADNGNNKKQLFLLFGVIGGLITSLFIFVNDDSYYLASLLAIGANCCFGVVNVLINSYLTLLVNNSCNEIILDDESEDSTLKFEKVGAKISGIGTSTGYFSALIIQIASLFFLIYLKRKHDDLIWCVKTVVTFIGIWWLIWQLPISHFLRNIVDESTFELNHKMNYSKMIKKGYKELGHAITNISELKQVYYFLLGWFVLADSITTINSTAILFAKTELHMPMISLSKVGILVMISAILGSIVIPQFIVARYKWDLQHVLLGIIIWCLFVPIYGILFLKYAWEMYILAIWYGVGLGGLSTVSRSIFSLIIPKGKENIFFAIFSLTDKSSSIIGPLLVGMIVNWFHDLRLAFWFLGFLLVISAIIFYQMFSLQEGREESTKYIQQGE